MTTPEMRDGSLFRWRRLPRYEHFDRPCEVTDVRQRNGRAVAISWRFLSPDLPVRTRWCQASTFLAFAVAEELCEPLSDDPTPPRPLSGGDGR